MQVQFPGSTWKQQGGEVTPRGLPINPGEVTPDGTPLSMPRVGSEAVTSPCDSHEDHSQDRMGSQVLAHAY